MKDEKKITDMGLKDGDFIYFGIMVIAIGSYRDIHRVKRFCEYEVETVPEVGDYGIKTLMWSHIPKGFWHTLKHWIEWTLNLPKKEIVSTSNPPSSTVVRSSERLTFEIVCSGECPTKKPVCLVAILNGVSKVAGESMYYNKFLHKEIGRRSNAE